MPHIQARTRQQLAAFLPSAITKALATYRELTGLSIDKEATEYKKHQEACKVAVAHIHLLVKLARDVASLSGAEEPNKESDDTMLQTIIENAQKELKEID